MNALKRWMTENTVTQAAFAEKLPLNPRTGKPLTQGAISQWINSGIVPSDWVPDVHRITGLPMSSLNPRFAGAERAA